MPRRPRALRDAMAERPQTPYLPDGRLDPKEWEIACTACNALRLAVLPDEPWFVKARPVEVRGQGVELEVVVRWLSPEVVEKVPDRVDGYLVEMVLESELVEDVHTLH
ncbi:hypothetical protein [Anaeromyxobacter sp. PSR-1]|uniref:hypothetical protein n=1 Tax=unclassified Anaeromyxobacter TaxID=2620896 RepID=UPI000750DEE6|nr:hypothetical protein [Anaeromyxobacter sp. PSR-1]